MTTNPTAIPPEVLALVPTCPGCGAGLTILDGFPVAVTLNADGTVDVEVDLSELADLSGASVSCQCGPLGDDEDAPELVARLEEAARQVPPSAYAVLFLMGGNLDQGAISSTSAPSTTI